jgi:hypothetical protein
MAASSTSVCLDEASPQGQSNGTRRKGSIRACIHASGRRSGDRFCVYVADRLVLPTLSQEDITAIGSGRDFERRFPEAERRAREAKLWAR